MSGTPRPFVPQLAPLPNHGVSNPLAVRPLYSMSWAESFSVGTTEKDSIHSPDPMRPAHGTPTKVMSPRARICAAIRTGTPDVFAGLVAPEPADAEALAVARSRPSRRSIFTVNACPREPLTEVR